ncbi:hypothetical protein [Dyadobacter sp. 3J3]|nr:hypothetical protein [Dyadobacter sp. 3J3]
MKTPEEVLRKAGHTKGPLLGELPAAIGADTAMVSIVEMESEIRPVYR